MRVVLAVLLGLALASPAQAQVCTASVTVLAFGNYDPFGSGANSTGSVGVTCTAVLALTVTYAIGLTAGASGTPSARYMAGTGGQLSYQIYRDAARSTVWGDGTTGSMTVSDGYGLAALGSVTRSYTAYGNAPARQVVAPGTYTDAVLVVISY